MQLRDLSTSEVARGLSVCPRTVCHWIDSGMLPGYKIPGQRHRRVPRPSCSSFSSGQRLPLEMMLEDCEVDRGSVHQ